jgi:hypothetical protein
MDKGAFALTGIPDPEDVLAGGPKPNRLYLHFGMKLERTHAAAQFMRVAAWRLSALARIFHQSEVGGLVPKRVFIGI